MIVCSPAKVHLSYLVAFLQLPSAPVYELNYKKPPVVEEPSECAFNQLTAIKINGFKGHRNEMRLIKFLLEKAILLKKLVLVMAPVSKEDSKSQSESTRMLLLSNLREQLLLLPIASGGRVLALYYVNIMKMIIVYSPCTLKHILSGYLQSEMSAQLRAQTLTF